MPITVKLRYLRIAPRKVRLVAGLIRGKTIEEAQNILNFTQKRAALPFLKILNQAMSNAKNNLNLDEKNLYISKILVDESPKLKRVMPRGRGHADEIQRKSSHIIMVFDEIVKKPKQIKKPEKIIKAEKIVETKEEEKIEKTSRVEKPNFRPEKTIQKTKERGIRRLFRRVSF